MDAEKERKAIDRLRAFVPPDGEPYYLCYSGGKDSDCIRILADLAGVPHEIHHNLTTVDAPETVRYIKSIPGCIIHRPERSMWRLIVDKKYPPTRLARYCCEELKERGGQGRMKVTGVRAAESRARRDNGAVVKVIGKEKTVQRAAEETGADYRVSPKGGLLMDFDNPPTQKLVHQCMRTTSTMLQPIIDWTTEDVWDFLCYYGCESNPLYRGGEMRIGCIGCPMAGGKRQKQDFAKWPKYRANYVRAFDRMLAARKAAGLPEPETWLDGEHVLRWWVGDDPMQLSFFDGEE